MKVSRIVFGIILLSFSVTKANEMEPKFFSGKVVDSNNGSSLSNVTVIVEATRYETVTAEDGSFSVSVFNEGSYTLLLSRIGYKVLSETVKIPNENIEHIFKLEPSPFEIGNVVINSPKFVQLERDASLPLEVVTRSEIEAKPSTTLPDVLENEPGLFLQRDGVWASALSIRGLSKDNVVLLIDGNRIETSTNLAAGMSLVDVADVERIEVIKGSASSLYGTGATGGVVNIQTKGGTFTDDFLVGGSLSSLYNTVNKGSKGSLSINASSENWYAKINTSLRYSDDVETPEGKLENSQFRDNSISAFIGLKPVENHQVKMSLQRFNATDVGIPGGEPFPGNSSATYLEANREMYSVEYSINTLFDPISKISAKYFYQEIFRDVEIIPNPNAIVNPSATHKMHGFQLQTNWVLNKSNFLIAGLDFWQREYDGKRERTIIPKKQIITDLPLPNSKFISLGFFAQNEIKVSNDFKLTLGGRIDRVGISNKASYDPVSIVTTDPSAASPSYSQKLVWAENEADEFSWSANLGSIYSLANSTDLILNFARSFRAPSLEERYQFIELGGAIYKGDPNLDSEKGWFVDAGLRYWGSDVVLRANIFTNLFNDLLVDEKVNDSTYIKTNIGEARLFGFELSAETSFIWDLILSANVSYVHGEDTGNNSDLPQIPPLNGRFGIKKSLAGIIDLQANIKFVGDQNKIAEGENSTGGYTYYDIYLTGKPFSFGLAYLAFYAGVENIFDRAYRNHLSTYRGITKLEPGRNIFIKLNLNW